MVADVVVSEGQRNAGSIPAAEQNARCSFRHQRRMMLDNFPVSANL